jgi:hypothetical protein
MNEQLIAAADATCNAILNAITDTADDIVANSPPGGGKTRLLEDATGHVALNLHRRVAIACPSNDQANDATRRIAEAFPQLRIDRFMATDATCPLSFMASTMRRWSHRAGICQRRLPSPRSPNIRRSTGSAFSPITFFFDEAFQVKKSDYDRIRGLAAQAMQIGDPGQIRPIIKTPIRHFAADPNGPHVAAPAAVLAANAARPSGILSWSPEKIVHGIGQANGHQLLAICLLVANVFRIPAS